jgi:tRNA pseudouridine38-40 synthase
VVRVRIDLAYDGAGFHGFARQPGDDITTVQGTLEGALRRLTGQDASTTGAGRTDRGVHALAQVVHVDLDPTVDRAARFLADLDRTRERVDAMVGPAITIGRVTEVDDGFDARFSAVERAYRYRLSDAPRPDPRLRGLRWHVPAPLDVAAMALGAFHLEGEHDFAALCRRAEGRHTVRRIDQLAVVRAGDEVHVTVRGPAFCHQQVRSLTGLLVQVGRGRAAPGRVAEVLASRDRAAAPAVAPPHGLTLERVRYAPPYPDAPPEDLEAPR